MAGNVVASFVVGLVNFVLFVLVMGAKSTVGAGAKKKSIFDNFKATVGFWRGRNTLHIAIALIGSIVIVPITVILTWAQSTEAENWGGSESNAPSHGPGSTGYAGSEMFAPALGLCAQVLITTAVAGLNMRFISPWMEGYERAMYTETLIGHGTVLWTLVGNVIGWLGHFKIIHDMHTLNTPEGIDAAVYTVMFFGVLYNFLLGGWFCFITWCSKADFQPYLCPVCEGTGEVSGFSGANEHKVLSCPTCFGNGETFLNP